jgi:hypothetical protein
VLAAAANHGARGDVHRALLPVTAKENIMSLFTLIVYVVLLGLLMWVVNKYVPMAEPIKRILNIAVAVILVLWLLSIFLPLPGFHDIRIGR